VFAPVWTTLFVLMAVAAWRVWPARRATLLWGAQLVLNLLWSVLFFGLRLVGAALAEILVLWAAILATTVVFWRRDGLAGALMLPYLAWVSFAIALNAAIWRLN
jgi:tryptophan-rich sensory protein